MLNKSHPFSRYKANSGKNKEKCFMHFDPDARVFVLGHGGQILHFVRQLLLKITSGLKNFPGCVL